MSRIFCGFPKFFVVCVWKLIEVGCRALLITYDVFALPGSTAHFSFLVNMKWSFQDEKYLYVVMEYLNGNDLRHYIKQRKEAVKYLEAEMDKQKEILASY